MYTHKYHGSFGKLDILIFQHGLPKVTIFLLMIFLIGFAVALSLSQTHVTRITFLFSAIIPRMKERMPKVEVAQAKVAA